MPMSVALPNFRYHPDPLATGSIVASPNDCVRCGQQRGYIYTGPVYAVAELSEAICPWCIADGSAARQFGAEFTDAAGVGDYGSWEQVTAEVLEEVARRTPGFSGWQQERWWTHCADAAAFLGRAGRRELMERWPEAVPNLMAEAGLAGAEWKKYEAALDADGSPTAYVFRCLHCGQFGGYSDCD
jgi:uncharacterized protein CbrC (UPF0167 family)